MRFYRTYEIFDNDCVTSCVWDTFFGDDYTPGGDDGETDHDLISWNEVREDEWDVYTDPELNNDINIISYKEFIQRYGRPFPLKFDS